MYFTKLSIVIIYALVVTSEFILFKKVTHALL